MLRLLFGWSLLLSRAILRGEYNKRGTMASVGTERCYVALYFPNPPLTSPQLVFFFFADTSRRISLVEHRTPTTLTPLPRRA